MAGILRESTTAMALVATLASLEAHLKNVSCSFGLPSLVTLAHPLVYLQQDSNFSTTITATNNYIYNVPTVNALKMVHLYCKPTYTIISSLQVVGCHAVGSWYVNILLVSISNYYERAHLLCTSRRNVNRERKKGWQGRCMYAVRELMCMC